MSIEYDKLDKFTKAYVTAALWSTNDDDGTPLDSNYDQDSLAPETLEKIAADCERFQREMEAHLIEDNCDYRGCPVEQYAGHDFWLTRNGHGCGFWDGDWKESAATILTDAAHTYGEFELYIGDDGLIYA